MSMAPLALPPVSDWPWVEIVENHARGWACRASAGAGGGTRARGRRNGQWHAQPASGSRTAAGAQTGVRVLRASRCLVGPVSTEPGLLPAAPSASPVKARIDLLLELLDAQAGRAGAAVRRCSG